jgi:hypothetical protein
LNEYDSIRIRIRIRRALGRRTTVTLYPSHTEEAMAQFPSKKARVDGYFTVVTKDPGAPHGSLIDAIAAAPAASTADGAAGGDDDNVENAGDDDAMGIIAWPFIFITFQSSCLTGAVSPRRRLKIPSSGR